MSLAFGLELQARAIAPLYVPDAASAAASATVHRFIVGTGNIFGGNKLQLLELSEDHTPNAVECAAVWTHENEIVKIVSSPSNTEVAMFAVLDRARPDAGTSGKRTTTLYALPSLTGDVVPVTTITSRNVTHVAWDPHGGRKSLAAIVSAHSEAFVMFNIEAAAKGAGSLAASLSGAEPAVELEIALPKARCPVRDLAWSPHHSQVFAFAAGNTIGRVDTRSKAASDLVAGAHIGSVLSIDFDPNRMHLLASSGEDGALRLWDLRKADTPALVAAFGAGSPGGLSGHTHFVNQARFNPSHDQIVLTASSDFTAKLWNVPSVVSGASAPGAAPPTAAASGSKGDGGKGGQDLQKSATATAGSNSGFFSSGSIAAPAAGADGVVRTVSDFGESVMACAWSAASPWVYAAVSFNGKVVVDKVPQELVMSILMGNDGE